MKGLLIFLMAVGGGGIATYGVLCHGPLPGLHIKSVALTTEAVASTTVLELDSATNETAGPLSLGLEKRSETPNAPQSASAAETPLPTQSESMDPKEEVAGTAPVTTSLAPVENLPSDEEEITEKTDSQNLINSIDLSRFEAIRDQDCTIGLKEIGFRALSLRRGSFQHGETLLWEDEFAKNKRISMLYASSSPVVRVKALAFSPEGIPQAAHVQEKSSGKEGVIALFVEGQNVPLVPVK